MASCGNDVWIALFWSSLLYSLLDSPYSFARKILIDGHLRQHVTLMVNLGRWSVTTKLAPRTMHILKHNNGTATFGSAAATVQFSNSNSAK